MFLGHTFFHDWSMALRVHKKARDDVPSPYPLVEDIIIPHCVAKTPGTSFDFLELNYEMSTTFKWKS